MSNDYDPFSKEEQLARKTLQIKQEADTLTAQIISLELRLQNMKSGSKKEMLQKELKALKIQRDNFNKRLTTHGEQDK